MSVLASLSTRGKITLAACALGFLVVAVVLVRMASAPSYTTVMAGVDPQKSGEVTAALSEAGIGFELRNGGTTVAVEKAKAEEAQIALASKGLNQGAVTQDGYEVLDKQKLGASSLQQQVAYQRALEGQIAQTISQIDGAGPATVRLTMPEDDLFADEKQAATAAVLLNGDTASMEPGAVKGIANLVASSVPQLKASAVTITDGTGSMLWPAGEGGAEGGGATTKLAAESKYNSQLASRVDALLASTLGAGKARVSVNSDLDVDKATEEKLEYADEGVPMVEETEEEELEGGGGAGGTAGANGNVPSYAAGAAGGGASNYTGTKTKRQMALDKTVTRREIAGGRVNRQSISVMVDANAKPDVKALTKAVQTAVGFDAARGDQVLVTPVPFAKVEEPKAEPSALPVPPAFAGILKAAGVGLGALLFLFFMSRHLKKREAEALMDQPSWLKELEAARPPLMAGPQLAMPDQPTVAMPSIATADPRRQQLDQIITNEPERVAAHLRSWITEDTK